MPDTDAGKPFASLRVTKMNASELGLVGWLLDAPEGRRRFVTHGVYGWAYCETGDVGADGGIPVKHVFNEDTEARSALRKRFGGRFGFGTASLVEAGILWSARYGMAASADFIPSPDLAGIDFGEQVHVGAKIMCLADPDAVAGWWSDGASDRYAFLIGKIEEKAAAVRRTAVFGKQMLLHTPMSEAQRKSLPKGYHFDLPKQRPIRPAVSATVVRETPARYYVEDVVALVKGGMEMVVNGTAGVDGGLWIDRNHLLADRVTGMQVDHLVDIDGDLLEDLETVSKEFLGRVVSLLGEANSVARELQVRHAELLAGIVGRTRTPD